MLRAMQKKTGTQIQSAEAEKFFLEHCERLSGADIEAVLTRARMKSALEDEAAVDIDDLKWAMEDFVPPSYPSEIELQNLVAVLECTSKGLLPEKYRAMDRSELIERTNQLSFLTRR